MSILIRAFGSLYISEAKVLTSSVLPTPVGPKNKKLPIGLLEEEIPALDLLIALEISVTALSCPIICLCRIDSKFLSLDKSDETNLETGTPVILCTIFATSSSLIFFLKFLGVLTV